MHKCISTPFPSPPQDHMVTLIDLKVRLNDIFLDFSISNASPILHIFPPDEVIYEPFWWGITIKIQATSYSIGSTSR